MEEKIRVRFAPSPTGPLHIGGARSALFNYLYAKKHQGDFIVRMEDTDLERSSLESEINIKESLRWLGIDWNEGIDKSGDFGPYRQTERLDIYQKAIDQLLAQGDAYYCYCTEDELEKERQGLLAAGKMPRYMGKCRDLSQGEREALAAEGRKPVIRFKVPEAQMVIIDDLVRGKVSFDTDGIGDFIIVKSDGIPTYNFAVVMDDSTMKISHVIRGEEHLSNTPRQILIYEALGLAQPKFAHVSLILGKDRSKMSKRHGSTSVVAYQEKGFLPEALVNFLVLLGWSPEGEEEIFSLQELEAIFDLNRVSKSPAVFDVDKLRWINGIYLREKPTESLLEMAWPYLEKANLVINKETDRKKGLLILEAVKDYLDCMGDIENNLAIFTGSEISFENEKAKDVLMEETVGPVLNDFKEALLGMEEELISAEIKKTLKKIQKNRGLKGKQVFMPVRVALTGQTHGPDLDKIAEILGRDNLLKRLISVENQIDF